MSQERLADGRGLCRWHVVGGSTWPAHLTPSPLRAPCAPSLHSSELNFGKTRVQDTKTALPDVGVGRQEPLEQGFLWKSPNPLVACQQTVPQLVLCWPPPSTWFPWPYYDLVPALWSFSATSAWVSAAPFDLNISFQIKYRQLHCVFWSGSLRAVSFKHWFSLEHFVYFSSLPIPHSEMIR